VADLQDRMAGRPVLEIPSYEDETSPIDRALYIRQMMAQDNLNVTETARRMRRSRAYVRNHLRLLALPMAVRDFVDEGAISMGHAMAIAKMRDPVTLAETIIRRQLSVRKAETLARRLRHVDENGTLSHETAIPRIAYCEELMEMAIGSKVRIADRAGRGKITISYKSPDQFEDTVHRLIKEYDQAGLDNL